MTTAGGSDAAGGRRSRSAAYLSNPVGPHLPSESHAGRGKGVYGDVFVDVDSLSMLS